MKHGEGTRQIGSVTSEEGVPLIKINIFIKGVTKERGATVY
jgi:hypothetical protein